VAVSAQGTEFTRCPARRRATGKVSNGLPSVFSSRRRYATDQAIYLTSPSRVLRNSGVLALARAKCCRDPTPHPAILVKTSRSLWRHMPRVKAAGRRRGAFLPRRPVSFLAVGGPVIDDPRSGPYQPVGKILLLNAGGKPAPGLQLGRPARGATIPLSSLRPVYTDRETQKV